MKNRHKSKNAFAVAALIAISVVVSVASAGETRQTDLPCGRQLPSLQPATLEGCVRRYCGDLPPAARLCACLTSEETGETQITLDSKGTQRKQWSVEILPPIFGAEAFRVDSADLNADGRDELLIAVMAGQGQGMGVQHWKLRSWDGVDLSEEIEVADYGVMSFLTCSDRSRKASLLGSQWINGWEPVRGHGLYIAGRWYELYYGRLSAVSGRPGVYHRYLFGLAEERGKELNKDQPKPVRWYSKPTARTLIGPYPFEQ